MWNHCTHKDPLALDEVHPQQEEKFHIQVALWLMDCERVQEVNWETVWPYYLQTFDKP